MNKKSFSQAFAAFFTLIFGRLNWSSPPWVRALRSQAQRHPKPFYGTIITLLLFLIAIAYGLYWFAHLPKPQLITAFISAPEITPIEDNKLAPRNLTIDFGFPSSNPDKKSTQEANSNSETSRAEENSESNASNEFTTKPVAPLNMLGKEVTKGIDIQPSIKGTWLWDNDSRLIFTPQEDWPAGQTFKIRFAKDVFRADTKLERYDYSFDTQAFQAKISDLSFYQDPVNPKLRQATATIDFNFPVDPSSLENKTSLILQEVKNGKLNLNAQQFKFNLTFDDHKRVAYLRSEPLSLPEVPRFLLLTIEKGLKALKGDGHTQVSLTKNLLIPDAGSYFKITASKASIIRNEQDRPEQILTIETSLGVTEKELAKSLKVYLLPQNYPATAHEDEKENYEWQNPGEITPNILKLSSPLSLQAIPADRNFATLRSYKFNAKAPRYMYLKLDRGTKAFGDFVLNQSYSTIIKVPELPKEISFLHKGALLALNSDKKLSVLVRGIPAVKFNFARVLPSDINQLVTQTEGDFNNPYFINQNFNQQNISQIFSEIQQFDDSDPSKQQYTAVDFNKYLSASANPSGPQGLFLLQANGWDVTTNSPLDVKASRLVLITDLGLVVKDNRDGSHDVFVQSITEGVPVPNVNVSVLGKNGLPLLTYATDAQGRANFPSLTDFSDDREPVVYLASQGADVSFIPYNNPNRQLNFSRFDVGGVYSNYPDQNSLSAYLFSDRGIYRPGDEAHIAMIVKQAYAQPQPPGLLLEATVTDPRGTSIYDQQFTLDNSGYSSFDLPTTATTLTGQYQVNLYIVKDKHAENLLGSTSFRIAEFQPDRMRISSNFSQGPTEGWVNPKDLNVKVHLWNLYGSPAVNRRVNGKLLLSPKRIEFKKYPDYIFADPLVDPQKPAKVFTDNLADVKTNEQGEAEFKLKLDRFDKATYQLTFFGEGFETEGGRSVSTQSSILVSPLDHLLGYKPDGDLSYVKQNSQRSVSLMAINPQLQPIALSNLKVQLLSLHPVTTLVKKDNGSFQYQSIIQSSLLSSKPFSIDPKGNELVLPTDQIGDFAFSILDENNTELSRFKFSIIGASQQPLAKNAELSVKLNKTEFKAGEDIELQITSPYTGSGLITIERDKVYAVQWFKTSMTNSVQRIHIPENFQGNGYVNVAFVRDWNSPDIFISPLSYSVTPFAVDHDNHNIHINLETKELAKPGEPFVINYSSDKAGKIIVFAVDEGILQVANYSTPNPLAFFFQKRALEVLTQQTVDQILPQYIKERELSAVGGDGGEEALRKHLNPFKRKTDLPVVFWSGIIDTDTNTRQLSYNVPDYFNGTLRLMAVAASSDSVGSAEKKSQIRGDFVINPNTPTFVSPGDVFEITASIANNVTGAGQHGKVDVQLTTSPGLEIVGPATTTLTIAEGHEQTARFKLKANTSLGSAKISLLAKMGDHSSKMDASLSIRPASNYLTTMLSGMTNDKQKSLPLNRLLYPEYQNTTAAASGSPMILLSGLQQYLDSFPYGCTEQLTSKGMPLLAMADQPWFSSKLKSIDKLLAATVQMLSQRQMSNGSFSYWPGQGGDNYSTDFSTVYAMHFLTEAKNQGYSIPNDIYSGGVGYLKDLASKSPTDFDMARVQAYAIYILTRNEIVTTNYLTNLQLYMEKEYSQKWQQDIAGAYMASTYQMLKSFNEANELISKFKILDQVKDFSDFYDANIANAQYLYLIAKHFPERLPKLGNNLVNKLVSAMNSAEINTVLSGYITLAFSAYGQSSVTEAVNLSIGETLNNNLSRLLNSTENNYVKAKIDDEAKQVNFINPNQQNFFYQLVQSGFDKNKVLSPVKNGVEIYREYQDGKGNVINTVKLGDEIEVHIQIRALEDHYYSNIAIVDLLPGGFEVVRDSVKSDNLDYVDIREDRVIFFTGVDATSKQLVYRIKATNIGSYQVPAVSAESMYHPNIHAEGISSMIEVSSPAH
ncbi:alpha-2-macroglobulin family protein [Legionella jordanis]|uniref:Alpha-2-macroglobulin n=1 Tax=Legionella jordanis TaxID=456 RepID=A0A0W0VAT0_9GAMM|nr:alpha-2-macroglobulin [Legionella jordanis]KTD17226.1 hypothetical protein Ljor_1532 [Legionella jordanis]RMX03344.1 alpha-2-macroglobulin family protein [Legionella jordanis]RMX15823.1 alpha-2-macroglobulin family protein [Legionella jordanis]VEH12576.1 Alpha-2-macroglobulin [Legionella jordanis]